MESSIITDIVISFLLSVSPLGEARAGLPYALINDINPFIAYIVCLVANILVYPIMVVFLNNVDKYFWRFRLYKKASLFVARRAKSKAGETINKYGFWGLMIFVMIPLPVTGAYIGSIAAHIFRINMRKAFYAISLGLVVSCLIVAVGIHFSLLGIRLF